MSMDRPNNIPPHLPVIPGSGLDVGRGRAGKPNQDNLGLPPEWAQNLFATKGRLYIVADGMGGAAGGQEASQIAVNTTFQVYYQDSDSDIARSLVNAIQAANAEVYRRGHSDPALQGMGTTIVAAVLRGDSLVVAHVGDSRAYLLRGSALHRLTQDHSWVQEQVDSGLLTHEQAARHEQRNVLSRNLGNEPRARPDVATHTLIAGDALLLCSDGLWGVVSDAEIAAVLQRQAGDPAAQTLIEMANQHGGPDNIAVLTLHVGAPGRRPAAGGRQRLPLRLAAGVALVAVAGAAAFLGRGRLPGASGTALATTPAPTSTATAIAAAEGTGQAPAPSTATPAPPGAPPTSTLAPTSTATPTPVPPTTGSSTPVSRGGTVGPDGRAAGGPSPSATPSRAVTATLLSPASEDTTSDELISLRVSIDGMVAGDQIELRMGLGENLNASNQIEAQWTQFGAEWSADVSRLSLSTTTYFWTVAVIGADGTEVSSPPPPHKLIWNERPVKDDDKKDGGESGGSGGKPK